MFTSCTVAVWYLGQEGIEVYDQYQCCYVGALIGYRHTVFKLERFLSKAVCVNRATCVETLHPPTPGVGEWVSKKNLRPPPTPI